ARRVYAGPAGADGVRPAAARDDRRLLLLRALLLHGRGDRRGTRDRRVVRARDRRGARNAGGRDLGRAPWRAGGSGRGARVATGGLLPAGRGAAGAAPVVHRGPRRDRVLDPLGRDRAARVRARPPGETSTRLPVKSVSR